MSDAKILVSGAAPPTFEALLAIEQSVLDAIPSAVYVCSAEGVLVRHNRRAIELWGRSPRPGDTDERFCGAFRLYHLDGRHLPHANTPMETALRTGEPQRSKEVIVERPDGSRVIVQVNIEPLRGQDGCIQGAINCFQDITERRRAEEELKTIQSDLEDFFENAAVAMHWLSVDGTILRANQAELDMLGYTSEEYLGRPIAEFHADRAAIEEILGRFARGEKLYKVRANLRAKDGSTKHVLISSSPLYRDGKLANTRCVTLDATAERLAYQLAAIVDCAEDAIVGKDLNGIVTSWNRGAERLFGYSAEDAVGKPITILIPLERQDEETRILERIRRGERVAHYETIRRRKDGSLIDISLTVSPVIDAKGRVIGASKIARDITERKDAEQNRKLLIDELNHRVKNTLAIVQGMAQQTFRGEGVPPEARKTFEGRLAALAAAHNLLTRGNWEKAYLHDIADEAIRTCGPAKNRVSVEGPPILLQPKQAGTIAMALHELCTNAVKYGALSNETGRVTLEWGISDAVEPRLELAWRESGGPAVSPPKHRGFGTRMIEQGLAQDLKGTVVMDFSPKGLVCAIDAPLPRRQKERHERAEGQADPPGRG